MTKLLALVVLFLLLVVVVMLGIEAMTASVGCPPGLLCHRPA